MQQYFNRMSMFVNDQALPQRIRFMIQDVIDLRRHRWVPRKAIVGDGPLPIHEVRIVLYRLEKLENRTIVPFFTSKSEHFKVI